MYLAAILKESKKLKILLTENNKSLERDDHLQSPGK